MVSIHSVNLIVVIVPCLHPMHVQPSSLDVHEAKVHYDASTYL
jgi:hypothetical protein